MKKHEETYWQLAFNITYYRKKARFTQMQWAEIIGISRTHMSNIEAPNIPTVFTSTVLLNIADAMDVELVRLFDFTL